MFAQASVCSQMEGDVHYMHHGMDSVPSSLSSPLTRSQAWVPIPSPQDITLGHLPPSSPTTDHHYKSVQTYRHPPR